MSVTVNLAMKETVALVSITCNVDGNLVKILF